MEFIDVESAFPLRPTSELLHQKVSMLSSAHDTRCVLVMLHESIAMYSIFQPM